MKREIEKSAGHLWSTVFFFSSSTYPRNNVFPSQRRNPRTSLCLSPESSWAWGLAFCLKGDVILQPLSLLPHINPITLRKSHVVWQIIHTMTPQRSPPSCLCMLLLKSTRRVYFPLNLMSYSDQQNVAEVTLCWCQAWALRGMVGFSFAFLEALRCHVKKSDHPAGEGRGRACEKEDTVVDERLQRGTGLREGGNHSLQTPPCSISHVKEAVFDTQASDKLLQPTPHRETGAVPNEPCLNYRITSKEMVFSALSQ